MRLMEALRAGHDSGNPAWSAPAVYTAVAAAALGSAALGASAIDPHDSWYEALAKPSWQPPRWAFPVVWTPLYASIAWAGGRTLLRARPHETTPLAEALAVNLALNSAFGWAFFRARSPLAGLAATAALSVSCGDLVRRTARVDRTASAALVPYAAWSTFATALNASIWRSNR